MTEKERLKLLAMGGELKNSWIDAFETSSLGAVEIGNSMNKISSLREKTIAEKLNKIAKDLRTDHFLKDYEKQFKAYTHQDINKQIEEAIAKLTHLELPRETLGGYLDHALGLGLLMPQNSSKNSSVEVKKIEEIKVPQVKPVKINSIQLNNFRFFTDDEQNNTFNIDGKNVLIYGENGSGKSSLFKAFEFLAKKKIEADEFESCVNKFSNDSDTFLEFWFDNGKGARIDRDYLEPEENHVFIKNLSIFMPMLNYQKLLQISYSEQSANDEKNLYSFFEAILGEYPIGDNKILSSLRGEKYFAEFKRIINNVLLEEINIALEKFDHNFKISEIVFDGFDKTVFLKIDYFEQDTGKFHLFLNEARLSALAMSIYFAIIKKQFSYLQDESLKILVLDDLLISLDMNNRMHLVDILKSEFSDFQIFFFTHDKGLFEIFKDKMEWKAFEIYVDRHNDGYEIPFLKTSNSLLEQAKLQKHLKNYDCSANLLRQSIEKLLCKFLPPEKLVNRNCKALDLNGLIQNAIAFENAKTAKNQAIINSLTQLQTFRRVILNSGSHYNDVIIYKKELEEAIDLIETLRENLE
ncbi:MAG: hypothetical protein KN64_01310 [Sulfurovum sp. AS07-7]|nr:MAG: hypothetical protein KN64_01310 [Sulfurovum sp. AS07-7]